MTFEYGSGAPEDILECLRTAETALSTLLGQALLALIEVAPNDGERYLPVIQQLAANVHGPLTGAICDLEGMVENSEAVAS